jgi:hypothetical protein
VVPVVAISADRPAENDLKTAVRRRALAHNELK